MPGVRLAADAPVAAEPRLAAPPAVRHLSHVILAVRQNSPKLVNVRSTRKITRDANDSHSFAFIHCVLFYRTPTYMGVQIYNAKNCCLICVKNISECFFLSSKDIRVQHSRTICL